METPAELSRAHRVSLYFQCSEIDGAKWQISEEMCLSRFQIETPFLTTHPQIAEGDQSIRLD
jgi:hypothetical protein